MKASASLAAALSGLTYALDESDADLTTTLDQFSTAAELAVGSYVGLTVQTTLQRHQLGFTALHEEASPADIITSLRMELSPSHNPASAPDADPTVVLILYATAPGAFVDLSADLTWLLGSSRGSVIVLDENLVPPTLPALGTSLAVLSVVNQAIGVLIGRGHTPDQAREELERLSRVGGHGLSAGAEQILDRPGGQEDPDAVAT